MQACFALHREVWSYSDADLIPVRLFVVASKIGGQVMGAFDGKELAGFALALPATRNGHLYLHSQMLAVRQQYRNAGVGRRLKLFQREEALSRGIELMEWTFDPLEIKNAYLNIEKLGAIARRYNVNQYGVTSSPLQGGLPTDRLVAEWWMNSERVKTTLASGRRPSGVARTADRRARGDLSVEGSGGDSHQCSGGAGAKSRTLYQGLCGGTLGYWLPAERARRRPFPAWGVGRSTAILSFACRLPVHAPILLPLWPSL